MKEYPKLRLISAKTRAEVIKDMYPEDKFLAQVTQRIIEDIKAAILFNELDEPDDEINTPIEVRAKVIYKNSEDNP